MAEANHDPQTPELVVSWRSSALLNPLFKGCKSVPIAAQARGHHDLPIRDSGVVPEKDAFVEEVEVTE
jgi:hypothetical protein